MVAPACDGGRAVEFSLPVAWANSVYGLSPVAQMASDGVTVVAVPSPLPSSSVVLLRAFTKTCHADLDFGNGGSEEIDVRVDGRMQHGVNLSATAPGLSNSIILVGTSDAGMLVGIITADGQVDRSFGSDGWELLPWPAGPTAVLQERSGEIVVGDSVGGGCCETEWVGALSADGHVLRSFGAGGRVRLGFPPVEDEEIEQLSVASNGDLLVLNSGGHMGVWESYVSELNPRGQLVQSFSRNLEAGWRTRVPPVFIGGLSVKQGGFVLIGAGQLAPVSNTAAPSATGRLLEVDNDGRLVKSASGADTVKFPNGMLQGVWVFSTPTGGYLMVGQPPGIQTNPSSRLRIEVVAFTRDGSVASTYGASGHGYIELPSPANGVQVMVTGSGNSGG